MKYVPCKRVFIRSRGCETSVDATPAVNPAQVSTVRDEMVPGPPIDNIRDWQNYLAEGTTEFLKPKMRLCFSDPCSRATI